MLIEQVKTLSPIDRLVYWITEREKIRLARASGRPAPWTDDEILRSYRFTNPRRMDDRVSAWLLDTWYTPFHGHRNMAVACTLARQLNRIETLEAVGFPDRWRPEAVKKKLRDMQGRGEKVFSAAYMITGTLGGTKIEQVVDKVVGRVAADPPAVDPTSMESTWKLLVGRPGMASFMAGQVTADLRWAVPGTWRDRGEWAPVGPGSARGLAMIIHWNNWQVQANRYHRCQEEWLTDFRRHVLYKIPQWLPANLLKRLEAMDYQNCLCEYFGYNKVLMGLGRKKQLYPGTGNEKADQA